MSLREEQCKKVCRILDNVLANRPTERDSLIVAVRKAFAEPQIIHCKDCKYYHCNIACVGGEYSGCSLWLNEGNEIEVEENDFCSCAERRTDG